MTTRYTDNKIAKSQAVEPQSSLAMGGGLSAAEYEDIKFPIPILKVLIAQSAAAEVRRRYESQGDVFKTIASNPEFQREFIASYYKANLDFYDDIKRHIPLNCRRILDIGCGIGLIDLLIYREIQEEKPELFLFDKSVDINQFSAATIAPTGFNQEYVFTAALDLTKQFLILNGVDSRKIHVREVGHWDIAEAAPVDLVISRKSWGFHYPIGEYLTVVAQSISSTGIVITDVRNGASGREEMSSVLRDVRPIKEGKKSSLLMACRGCT